MTIVKLQPGEVLKSCPFCGGEAALESVEEPVPSPYRGAGSWSVGCMTDEEGRCYGYQSLTTFARRSEAIAAWNRRAGEKE